MSIENGIPGMLNKCSSNFRYVEFGVRQGRILSPFLFNFNINNILDSVYFSLWIDFLSREVIYQWVLNPILIIIMEFNITNMIMRQLSQE